MNKKIFLFLIAFLVTTSLWSQDYDYQWTSSDSSGGPTYSWVDITSVGTQIQMTGDDFNTGPFNIGFNFPYYGNEYTTFRICTNGFISFTSTSSQYNNYNLPGTSAPENLLAPFWDDLSFYSSNLAYYHNDGSRLIITYNDVPKLGYQSNSSFTFQIILYPSGEIVYQYQTMTYPSSLNSSTIGWQDSTRTQGTAIVYQTTNYNIIQDNLAIRIEDEFAGIRPPTVFTAAPSYQTATLSWTASSTDTVASYVLSRGPSSNTLALYDSVTSTVTSYIDSNLINGTTYYYGAKSKSQNGVYSSTTTANTTPRVDTPDSLSVTAGHLQATLSWTAATGSGVSRTLVYQGTSSSSLSLVDSTSNDTTTSKVITGLTNGTTYYFEVRTRGEDNSLSLASNSVSVMPQYVGPVWWVATNGSNDNDGYEAAPFSTITAAITAASDGDTVKIKSGTYTGTGNRGINPGSKKVVIISAANDPDSTILDAGNNDHHFYLTSSLDSTFQLIGLTLKNGSYSNGGSIYISNTSPRITNCVFKDNVSANNGGAVYIQGSSEVKAEPVFTNCTFRDNQTKYNGGAIYMSAYGEEDQNTPRFVSCIIISNDVSSAADDYAYGYGGGFYSTGEMRPMFIDCQIDSNTVVPGYWGGYGGGGYINAYSGGATSTFTRCTFRGNTVTPYREAQGGALYAQGEVELTNCLISGNSAVGGGSSYSGQGGGIYIYQYVNWNNDGGYYQASESKIINCTIVNNSASGESSSDYPGGAYFVGSNATVTMFNTIIWGNTSDNDSYNSIQYNSSGVTLAADYNDIEDASSESWFNPNSVDIDPQFTNANSDYSLSDASPVIGGGASSYEGYSAPTNDITGAARPDPASSSPDLGAYENSLSATPYPNQVAGLSATADDQQVVLSWTANTESDIATYKVYKDTASGFTPSSSTLAATVTHPTVTATITGLTNNEAYYFRVSAVDDDSYEGSYSDEISATPEYSGPVWWVATSGSDLSNEGSRNSPFKTISKGGTKASTGDTIKVVKGTYSGSSNRGLNPNGKNLVVISVDGADSTFLDAGSVDRHFSFNNSEDTTFQVIGFTLQNGKKINENGGSVYIYNASPKFKNCIFKDNEVTSSSYAGAVYIYNGSPIFNNCTFRDNSSESYGGAISIQEDDSAPVFNNCIITSNSASNDAGDYRTCHGGGIYVNSGAPTFNDCQITYNTVSSADYQGEGGGVYIGSFNNLDYDPVTFNRCKIVGNSVSSAASHARGGGMEIFTRTVLSSCLIADNTATAGGNNNSEGGGLRIYTNSLYNSNTESYETAEVVIVNCTITGNEAAVSSSSYSGSGGGMYVGFSQDVRMFNTIIWDNTADYIPNLYSSSGAGLTSDYNDIQDGTDEYYFGSNSLDEDPNFSDAAAGDYTLTIASNLIGAGASTYESYSAPAKDVAENDRPNPSGSSPDMGAYENSYASSPYPAAPSNLSASAGNAQITLHWDAHSETDVTTYGIYYGTSANPTVKQLDVSGRTTDSTVVTGLSNNIIYYFRITAIDGDNYESGFSDEVSKTPQFSGSTIYVDGSLSSYTNPDGSSTNPFENIQDAIDAESTTSGKRILVKHGTYSGSGSTSNPVIDLNGKNLIIEAQSGPDSTTIDAGGNRIALDLDSDDNEYSGYSNSSTKFIGFTFTDGDDENPLINIDGPEASNSSNSWGVTFENCRFTNTENDNDEYNNAGIIVIVQSNTVFDGCTFRELNIDSKIDYNYSSAPIKLEGGTNWYWNNDGQWVQDPTIYQPQFKNCVIAKNSLKSSDNDHSNDYYGGAIYVGNGAIPYFENTRIDSNEIDPGSGATDYGSWHAAGGGVYLSQMYDNGPPITFINCSISHNTIKGYYARGGGVYTKYGQTQFINCVITGNEAEATYPNPNNYANAYGGGIYYEFQGGTEHPDFDSKDPQLLILNSTIADNVITPNTSGSSTEGGAGISRNNSESSILMFNSIVCDNTIAGVSNTSMNMSVTNSAFGDNETVIGYSIIQYAEDSQIDGDEILETNPRFTGNGDYSLSTASAAIGAGTDEYEDVEAPAFDYNNNVRPNPSGSDPDLGAFENALSTTPYPGKPQNLTVSSTGDSSVTLNWTAVDEDDLSKYRIYSGTSSPATTLTDSASATATSKTVSGLTNDTDYHFRIRAMDQEGYESDYSNEVEGTPSYKGPVWYVDDAASGVKDGSPANPFKNIDDAMADNDNFSAGDTIMVMPGTYDGSGNRNLVLPTDATMGTALAFVLMSKYGADTTFVDLSGSGTTPKYQFMYMNGEYDSTTQFIGLTFQYGGGYNNSYYNGQGGVFNFNGQYNYNEGEWEYVNPLIRDCVFEDNEAVQAGEGYSTSGGAVYIQGSSPRFENCTFTNNSAFSYGGAVYVQSGSYMEFYQSNPKFYDCTFDGNSITNDNDGYGGAIYLNQTQTIFERCRIINNTSVHASAIYAYGLQDGRWLQIKNTLIANNVAQNSYNNGTVIYTDEGDDESGVLMEHVTIANNSGSENYKPLHLGYSHIVNSIIWGNASPEDMVISRDNDADVFIQYSLVQNGEALENFDDGLTIDPRFTDTGNGDYTLSLASFALGAGTDEYESPITEDDLAISGTDLAGNDRIQPVDSDPDMGAYESSNALSPYPNPPSNLSADEKHQAVDLSWSAPFDDDVVKYFVYQADSTSSGWSSWAVADTLDSLTSTATTITGLTNGRLYSFYVTSIDTSDYESVVSNAVKAVPEYFGPVWYVDAVNGSSNGEGSPENSYKEIQSAIDKTDPLGRTDGKIDTVLVLPGTYDDSDDRQLYFKYTTFGSNEGQPKNIVLKSRDGAATTILNGGNKRVFELVDQTDTTLHIIGFTITATNGGENDGDGSAIKIHGQSYWQGNQEVVTYSGATFKNCIIKDIDGEDSAVELYYGSAIFNDCEIFGNTFDASNVGNDAFGGAIRVGKEWTDGGSRVYFNRCKLVNNTITTDQYATIHGGALAIGGSNQNYVKMVNSIVAGNIVSFENTDGGYTPTGGAIKSRGGILQLINCTVANNQIITDHNQSNNNGSAIHSEDYNNEGDSPQLTIYNSIVYGNTTVTNASSSPMTDHTNQIYADDFNSDGVDIYASYSLFGGDDDLGGDDILLNTRPEFADTTFVLHERSPAIGAGATASIDAQGETIYAPSNDLAGNTRPNPAGSDPDLGVYEHELDVTLYPNPPSNLSADEKHQAVDLSWSAPFDDDVVKYYVYQSADSTNWTVVDTLDSLTSTTTEIIGLTNDEDYWFYVTSIDTSDYESVNSNEVKTTPHYLGPVWYVDEEEGSSGGEGSLEDPATYIRDMIEMAANGDTILVMPGNYTGSRNRNLDFQYNHDVNNDGVKNLVLKSAYGPDTTIIDLNGQDFINFTNNEDNSSKIIGFTITNSNFGAVEIMNSSPEIDNCIFLSNQNNQNGGAINISETNGEIVSITNTLFDGNSIQTGTSNRGGAIMLGTAGSMAYVENCIFYNNSSDEMGGAINQDNSSHLVIVQSLFVNNTTNSSWGAGGVNSFAAMSGGYTTIINSIFSGNTNTSGSWESGVYSSNGFEIDVDHCILQSENNSAFNYGENYVLDPFINDPANGDFSLGDFSNAIGLGTDEYYNPFSDDDENMPATDFNSAARPQPEGSNPDLGPIEHWRGEPRRYVYLVDTTGNDISGDGLITPFKSIQKGLLEAAEFDTVEVAAGTYKGVGNKDLHFMDDDGQITRRKVLRSADGPETTIIDCEDNGRGFDIADLDDSGTKVIGFTVTNGSAVDGGAVYVDNADVEFSNMILDDNSAGSGNGGAVYVNNGYVGFLNCIITDNTANKSGAVYVAGGEVGFGHNTIVGNHSSDDVGLTVESGSLEIHNSIIWRNSHTANEVEAIGAGELEVNHSIVYGSADGDGIFTGRPGFTDGSNDDFSLLDWSPAIGRADTSEYDLYGQYDIFGNARTYSDSTWGDLGAIENTLNMADLSLYTSQIWYADTAGVDSSADGSITDPFGTIQHAADYALYTDEVMMNAGTYNQDFTNRGKDIIFRSSNDPSEVTINGVAIMDGGSPQLYWLTFSGAGAEIEAIDSDVNIYNVEISSVGDGSDAALDVSGGNPVLYQVTFADNSDNAIHVADSANVTAHSIAFYNTGSHWESAPGCTISVTYSLTDSSGTGNIAVDPGFLGVDNYKLAASSLLINAGDISNTDADGSRSDIGAYSYNNDFNGPIWYVTTAGDDTSGTGSNDSPFASVQAAINFATTAGDSIAVGSGTFTENVHFRGRQVKVHGTGYYSTVIDGGSAGSVVHFDGGEDQSTVLADMTLENGSADYGGGIYAYNASPILKNLYISDNYAATGGGGINLTTNSNPSLTNVIIANNSTGDHGGGIVFHDSSDASLDRVTVADNSANVSGNGLWLWGGSSPSVTNSIIWNGGSEIELSAGSPVTNSITVTYSDVNGSYTGTGNINDDPLFTDASNEDYSLQITSPCIDAGDPSFIYDADSTVVDMGALPLLRYFLTGTSTGNVEVSGDTTVVISGDYTVSSSDTLTIDPGATVYFDPNATLIVDGVMAASGEATAPITFVCSNPDSTYSGVEINTSSGGRDHGPAYDYMLIKDVGSAFVPLSITGDAELNHITIAGNENSFSLEVLSGIVNVNYSILEGSTTGSGTINNIGSFTSSTSQFVDYSNGDYTLLTTAAAIDADTSGDFIDPDYTFADAGCFYHDQTGYISDSVSVLYPVYGDTILVSPDTSSAVGSGLAVEIQIFNTIGHYMTNPTVQWGNTGPQHGTFASDTTFGADLRGRINNTFYTTTTTGDLNAISADEFGSTAQSGFFNVVPGDPDSVWVNEQADTSMTQFATLGFGANIYDQFANLVADGEIVDWNIVPVVGNGDGFTLSYASSTTSNGSANVAISTDPTGNDLAVGDQVKVSSSSGTGTHESGVVTVIPDDIYNLTMPSELTEAQIDVSADEATLYIEAALIDTFDNPLENVEINWEVVTGAGTGESLSATSSFTNVNGIAWVDLNTSTLAGSDYTVHGWVTEDALLAAVTGQTEQPTPIRNTSLLSSIASFQERISREPKRKAKQEFHEMRNVSVISVPVQIISNNNNNDDQGRDHSVYDLDDTTAVIHVIPGVTANIYMNYTDSTDVLLDEQFQVEAGVFDQFGNDVAEGTPVTWTILPSTNVTIQDMDATTANGAASIDLQVNPNATWEDDFIVQITVESVTAQTAIFNIHDITAPEAVSDLAVSPDVWTSVNEFTLTWTNPSEHAGVAGAHYSIDGVYNYVGYMEGQNITTLTGLTLPANTRSTFDVWLEDNATNHDNQNAVSIIARWDDFAPDNFTVTAPLDGFYNSEYLRFEWNPSADAIAGLRDYIITIDGSTNYTVYPDSTGYNWPDGFIAGQHDWTISAFDSSGNETITSNPQPFYVDFTNPGIAHNPVLEGSDNSPVTITATFTDDASGIDVAELYYRKGGEAQWQTPVDMKTLNTYQIASSFVTSVGVEYYIYTRDVAGNETFRPNQGHYSISVNIPGAGLSSTDRWPTGVPNGSAVSSYQLMSFPGQAANATPTNILVDDLLAYDDTKWRFFTYAGGGWNEFATINTIDPGVGYFLIVKDPGFNITTGQTRTVTTDDDFTINFTSGEWVMLGNPFDFSIPLENVLINDSTNLVGDPNFYTYDGANGWVAVNKLDPWKGYVYKSATANQLYIKPSKSSGGLKIIDPKIVLHENEWLIDIIARNGLGVDKLNTVGVLTTANDEYDAHDAFEPPMLPGGISLRIDNRDWAQYGDIYSTDIRTVKEDGEFWDTEVAAQDEKHNVYLNYMGIDDIPAEFDVFAIDVTLGIAQDLRWNPVYRYAVSNPEAIHNIRFIAGTKEFVKSNNAGVELYPDRFSISQNYPNPFNPQTSILITLEDVSIVDLVVYNLLGEEVIRIADNALYPAGYHNFIWKGLNRDSKRVASGVYFYSTRITDMSGKAILNQTKKMIMVK